MQIHTGALPAAAKILLPELADLPSLGHFYLSGGTALALQLGHRESEDLDFFTKIDFNPQVLAHDLTKIGVLKDTEISQGTLNTFISSVKLQFLYYPYSLLEKSISWNGIELSSVVDIACTKLITISSRGSKKDFIDIYVILKHYTLEDLFKKLAEKYQGIDYNQPHILKSLVYFNDAESQPMPKMHIQVDWDEVKRALVSMIKKMQI